MYLGIDLGTGTLKAAIFDGDGSLVDAAEEAYGAPLAMAGSADFDPEIWWDVCRRAVRRVTESHGSDVAAVGVAGQMHGVVLVDESGRPVRDAVLWTDSRAADELTEFSRVDHDHDGLLGNPLVPGMAGPILAWLARNEPERLREAATVFQPKDWLRTQLCGYDAVTDPSDASATLLYDVTDDDWSAAVCEAIGLDRGLLPRIHSSSGVVGRLDPAVADSLGLKAIPVVTGCGDAAAALLGAGIEHPGTALVNIGTGGQVMTPMMESAGGRGLGPGIHQYRSASEATPWYAMAAVANAGLALKWVRDILGFDWNQMYGVAGSVLDEHSTDPLFLPFLVTEREPGRDALRGGAWSGLTPEHDREALVRSSLRGVAFYLALRARALVQLTGVSSAVMSGGSARHHEWVELLATTLGLDMTVSADMHLTVRGAARLAARGVESDLPDPPVGRKVSARRDVEVEEQLRGFDEAVTRYFH